MIWRIRERRTFARLASEGQRTRAGLLWCTYLLDDDPRPSPPRVAFAIGRAQGSAVDRNRLRRRLRVLVDRARLPSGSFLIGAAPGAGSRSSTELQFDVTTMAGRIAGAVRGRSAP